jgi:uncharacterized protein (TIGR04255 family)
MPFPASERVFYRRSTLAEVICQVRFPPILRVESEAPAAFQESIRETFPLLEEQDNLPLNLPPEVAQLVRSAIAQTPRKTWRFLTDDRQWMVSVAREFLALSTQHYERWEVFHKRLEELLASFLAEYQPSFFTRVGLRYRNMIVRSALELRDAPWADLLQLHVAAEYSSAEVAPAIQRAAHEVLFQLTEGDGKVRLRHGTTEAPGVSEPETAYLIDSDFFTEDRTEAADVLVRLTRFNRQAARLFRWCVSDRLHDAMQPEPLPAPNLGVADNVGQ